MLWGKAKPLSLLSNWVEGTSRNNVQSWLVTYFLLSKICWCLVSFARVTPFWNWVQVLSIVATHSVVVFVSTSAQFQKAVQQKLLLATNWGDTSCNNVNLAECNFGWLPISFKQYLSVVSKFLCLQDWSNWAPGNLRKAFSKFEAYFLEGSCLYSNFIQYYLY